MTSPSPSSSSNSSTQPSNRAPLFEIRDFRVAVEGREIVRGLNLTIFHGEVHAVMGRNGSGKSTLANAVMGHPKYQVLGGEVRLNGENLLDLPPDERARRGVFLGFQNPLSISGVATGNFLRAAVKAVRGEGLTAIAFRKELKQQMEALQMDPSFATRALNEGFSGGEKKRAEVLQLSMLRPKVALLDEPDSGLDIDAVRIVSEGVNRQRAADPDMAVLLITHYQRILNYIKPDHVHVLSHGQIVESGGPELAQQLEREGYDPILARLGVTPEPEAEAGTTPDTEGKVIVSGSR